MMKIYKLLKNLPTIKAGTIFEEREQYNDKILVAKDIGRMYEIDVELIEDFDDWFEEIKSFEVPDEFEMGFWTIDFEGYFFGSGGAYPKYITNDHWGEAHYKNNLKCYTEIGWAFETKEEAEKHLEWLKARTVLIRDTKGFKPDWSDFNQMKTAEQHAEDLVNYGYNEAIDEFEQNLLKALEEV